MDKISMVLQLAWRSLKERWVQSIATIIVVGMALALFVSVEVVGNGIRKGVTEAADPFGTLVIGPKGDAQQLVLNSILLNGNPLGTIDLEIYEGLLENPNADLVIPLAMADNVGGAKIIGTTTDFFQLQPNVLSVSPFQIAEGRYFEDVPIHAEEDAHDEDEHEEHSNDLIEAVLGATAADKTNLKIGDVFVAAHGTGPGINQDEHSTQHIVVGVMHETNTAFDGAVFIPLPSVWEAHEGHSDNPLSAEQTASDVGSLTSVLVKPAGFAETSHLWQQFYLSDDAQAAYPGQELGKLFNTLTQLEDILSNVGYLAAGMAGVTIFLSIYSATVAREQLIAVMRGVGIGRKFILMMILVEAILLAVLGAVLARVLGYSAGAWLAGRLSAENGIPIPFEYIAQLEPLLWALPIGIGLLAGLIPAVLTYRLNVVEKLFGN